MLGTHKNLGVHTELLSDGMIDLVETGVVNGIEKRTYPGKIVTTFALGTKRLYDFLHENPGVEFLPVEVVNDPQEIAKEDQMISINATTEVDFFGNVHQKQSAGIIIVQQGDNRTLLKEQVLLKREKALFVYTPQQRMALSQESVLTSLRGLLLRLQKMM